MATTTLSGTISVISTSDGAHKITITVTASGTTISTSTVTVTTASGSGTSSYSISDLPKEEVTVKFTNSGLKGDSTTLNLSTTQTYNANLFPKGLSF